MLSQDIEAGHLNSGRGGISILRQIFNYRKGKLGSVSMQFGTPISMAERFDGVLKADPSTRAAQLDTMAFSLTRDLYRI
jgi:hypothetical protein